MRVWNSMRRLNLSNFFGFWNTLTDTHKNTCYMRLKKIILKTFQNTKQNKCIWTHKKEEQSEMIGIEQCSLNSAWQSCQFSLIPKKKTIFPCSEKEKKIEKKFWLIANFVPIMLNVILNISLVVVQNLPDCKMQMLITPTSIATPLNNQFALINPW